MNKKILVLVILALFITSCGSIVARKDRNQIVKFENTKIVPDKYKIIFYKINYPESPQEKDLFYKEFDILTSKMLVYKKDINLIIPLELYKDLLNLQKREVRESEKIYFKQAYLLTDEEKEFLDKNIVIKTPNNSGSVQKYLNKQVFYWYSYLEREYLYNPDQYYTELDKDKIVDEIFKNRKFFSNTALTLMDDLVIEVGLDQLEKAKDLIYPLYIETDILSQTKMAEFKSKIIIIDGRIEDMVIPGKILLINNLNVKNVKDYEISTEIIDVIGPLNLIPKLEDNKSLKLKDIQKFDVKHVPNSVLKKATLKKEDTKRETVNFGTVETKWRID